jgi:hypothetical protein
MEDEESTFDIHLAKLANEWVEKIGVDRVIEDLFELHQLLEEKSERTGLVPAINFFE